MKNIRSHLGPGSCLRACAQSSIVTRRQSQHLLPRRTVTFIRLALSTRTPEPLSSYSSRYTRQRQRNRPSPLSGETSYRGLLAWPAEGHSSHSKPVQSQ